MQVGVLAIWWWIGGEVVVALVAFVCWIAWELYHTPSFPELSDGFNLDEDDEEIHS